MKQLWFQSYINKSIALFGRQRRNLDPGLLFNHFESSGPRGSLPCNAINSSAQSLGLAIQVHLWKYNELELTIIIPCGQIGSGTKPTKVKFINDFCAKGSIKVVREILKTILLSRIFIMEYANPRQLMYLYIFRVVFTI